MKNITLTTLMLILFTGSIFSQNKYSFGFEFSPTLNWINSNTKHVKSDGSAFGIKYGIVGDKYFAENYALTFGLMFNHSSINLKYSDSIKFVTTDDNYTVNPQNRVTYNTQYFELPLGLKFKSNQIGYTVITFQGGLIPAVTVLQKGSIKSLNVDNENLSSETNIFNLSYYFQGGIEYSLGAKVAIKGALFYSNGLFDVTNDNNHNDDKITINTMGIKIGLVF